MRKIASTIIFSIVIVCFCSSTRPVYAASPPPGPEIAFDASYPIVGGLVGSPDIARDPNDVPTEPLPDGAEVIITAAEILAPLSPEPAPPGGTTAWAGDDSDIKLLYFAFGGGHPGADPTPKVPGPFIRVMEGRTVTVTLQNPAENTVTHSIDFHAVVGQRGGAATLTARRGETVSFTFVPKDPGLFVYHCVGEGNPNGIAHHMNNGMFGLILVVPSPTNQKGQAFGSLIKNATEHYVFQQDIWRDDKTDNFDEMKMLTRLAPDFSVYNGRVGALVDHPIVAEAGKNAVIYHGVSGGHIASSHIIGEVYDQVFHEGDILSSPRREIQTTSIPSAGSAVIVMDGNRLVPTDLDAGELNILVDHASPFFRLGALGLMFVNPAP